MLEKIKEIWLSMFPKEEESLNIYDYLKYPEPKRTKLKNGMVQLEWDDYEVEKAFRDALRKLERETDLLMRK